MVLSAPHHQCPARARGCTHSDLDMYADNCAIAIPIDAAMHRRSSPVVWAVDGDTAANRTVRLYARRAGGSDGDEGSSVVVFGSNVQAEAAALHFDPSMVSNPATRREDYVLTGDLGGDSILLNSVAMALELAGHGHDGASAAAAPTVPTFNGKVAANASEPLVMAPFSSFFSVFHHSVPPRSAPTRWHGK